MRTPHRPFRRLSWPALAALAAVAGLAGPALASHVGEELTTDQQAVQSNDLLIDGLRQYEALPASARAAREATLTRLAQTRRDRLVQLLERNPKLAAMRLLPQGLRERFPAAARSYIEQDVAQVGGRVFASVADDFARGVSRTEFKFMPDGAQTALTLHLGDAAGSERDLLGWTGRSVRLRGARIDGHLLVRQRSDVQLLAAEGTTTTTTSTSNLTPTMTPKITGDRQTLAVLANFSDASLTCTAADVATRVFGGTGSTVNTVYLESSRNVVGFSGTTAGPFTIPYSATGSCDYSGWSTALDAAVKAAGIDLTKYNHITYVTPRNSTCGWSGLAYMPGTRSWIQSCGSAGVYAHELGHNLSLHHAATPTSEYGDGSDSMGGARTVRTNGANQVMAGWVPTGGVVDVFVGGSYAVGALQSADNGAPQVLRLTKADTSEFYYVSLRQNTGIDSVLSSTYVNTLSIHRATGKLPAKTFLLQTVPLGGSFVDSVNGIQVLNQGVSNGVATVAVSFSGSTCERNAPTLSLSPATASAAPGSTVTYKATVTNNDTAACGSGSVTLAQAVPAGFTGTLSASSLALSPGASAAVNWNAASSSTVAAGTYTLDLTATGPGAGATSTAHASYVVMIETPTTTSPTPTPTPTPDTAPPTLTVVNPQPGAVFSGSSAALSATATDPSGVAAVEFYVGTTLLARDTKAPYSASWNLRKAAKGSHTVSVRAIDKLGNAATQQVSVTVQ